MNMKLDYPLFTVIIPQKDRAEYLMYTLETCIIQDYPNFEIIVSDDCSEDNSVEIVESLMKRDGRIKLFAHNHHLGMRDNFEFALSQVRPGYVMALGGDDGLLPGSIQKMYEIISKTGRNLLTWNPALFVYLDKANGHNIISVKRTKHSQVKIIKSEDFLNKIAKSFEYQIPECPMFYLKGVASTELVNKIKSRTEDHSFYYCPTPDGFSGVALAGEVEDYAYLDEPLSIVGSTTKSQGKNYGRIDDKSRKETEQFFSDNVRRTMHKELASQPYSPLTTLMTADYLLTARDLIGWPGKFKQISFENLLKASFKQIEYSPYDNLVLVRELKILREIAQQHNLSDLFNRLYTKTIRKKKKSLDILGFAITHSIRIDGYDFGITNIFYASQIVHFMYDLYGKMTLKTFLKMINNSIILFLRSVIVTHTIKLPQID